MSLNRVVSSCICAAIKLCATHRLMALEWYYQHRAIHHCSILYNLIIVQNIHKFELACRNDALRIAASSSLEGAELWMPLPMIAAPAPHAETYLEFVRHIFVISTYGPFLLQLP